MGRYVAPLLAAATVTGSLQRIMSARAYTAWVTPAWRCRLTL
jgi:cytochrome c-type biogenesis protein